MDIDHIFIFVDSKEAADELVDFGLNEGSGNVHKGIGTANRRFFFKNFYLEILWVENDWINSPGLVRSTFERFHYKDTHYSRFGVCFTNTKESNHIFEKAITWKPEFLQNGEHVDILTSKKLPWIFRFPPNRQKNLEDEPREHKAGLKQLTKAVLLTDTTEFPEELNFIKKNTILEFLKAETNTLVLEFDNAKNGKMKIFKNLDLAIKY